MGVPQLVGLQCAVCQRKVESITAGVFCPVCGNPVHATCLQVEATDIADGRCNACGGNAESPLAVEVRASRHEHAFGKPGGSAGLVCPACGSTRGFRPFRQYDDGRTANHTIIIGWFGILFILAGAASELGTAGQYQCVECDRVFRPPSRLRQVGCIVLILLAVAAFLSMVYLALGRGPFGT
jgi:DNA-directed RNA polymerase subunit RPC12/RpoP